MKYLGLIILIIILFIGAEAKAGDGKDLFESLRCGVRHKVDTGKTTPSLREITRAYAGNEERLVIYLQGRTDPIINPGRGERMKRYIEKTKALSFKFRPLLPCRCSSPDYHDEPESTGGQGPP
jgi:cytochrome c551/c552